MKITNLEVYELKIPFSIGIKSSSADFLKQDGMDFCVIKIETDTVLLVGVTHFRLIVEELFQK